MSPVPQPVVEAAPELAAFALLALAGAPHCAGMCGGLALAVGRLRPGPVARPVAWFDQGLFTLGKALTYTLLGLGLSLGLGGVLTRAGGAGLRGVLAWVAGLGLLLGGLASLGLVPHLLRAPRVLTRSLQGLQRLLRGLPGYAAPLGAGAASGLLPCGLSWSAVLLAASLSPLEAGLGMALFGLCVGPAPALVALGGGRILGRGGPWVRPVLGVLLVGLGLFTCLRGGLPGDTSLERTALPDCCQDDGVETAR